MQKKMKGFEVLHALQALEHRGLTKQEKTMKDASMPK